MEDEFQGGVCGGSWWNPSRSLFGPSPCSASEWLNPTLILDTKAAKTISGDSSGSASDGCSSVVLQEPPQLISNGNFNSTFPMMADDWNQDFLNDNARSQQNYSLNSTMNSRQKIADEWTTVDSSPNSFRQNSLLQQQPPQNSYSTSTQSSAPVLPLNIASYNYTSSFLHTLFDADSEPLLKNEATNYSSSSLNVRMNSAGAVPDFPGAAMKPSFPKQQLANNFQFINNANFWSATVAASCGEVRASFLPSSTPQLIPSALAKPKLNQKKLHGKAWETDSAAKRGGNEPPSKRPRMETPSPLPTFKVRKEKLGDRVTALQQLVSPFGKTDTASVLHEAIDYIKLLHDQVHVLSTPYLKNCPPPLQRQQATDRIKDHEEPSKDLRSRGLCLVPISSTFPMATETTADFWTPTFGASFR